MNVGVDSGRGCKRDLNDEGNAKQKSLPYALCNKGGFGVASNPPNKLTQRVVISIFYLSKIRSPL